MAAHSRIVGGSSAKRVIACPGSVALVDTMPPQPSSSYADEGTLLHDIIAQVLETDASPAQFLGRKYEGVEFTEDLLERKIIPALKALDEIDPDKTMEFAVETSVSFGDFLPGVFGSADLLGRIGNRVIVLDWKFGDGVTVEVENNAQHLFYTAAAMRTPGLEWLFKGISYIELVIVQPPYVRRWTTTPEYVAQFETELLRAVKLSRQPDAPMAHGEHCRWCPAKPICPILTGAVDRAVQAKLEAMPTDQIAYYLEQVPMIEQFISDLKGLAQNLIESGQPVPGWKLVNKRATRQWTNPEEASLFLLGAGVEPYEEKIISPAAAEKLLKKAKIPFADGLVVAVSSGSTLAPASDPRPDAVQIGQQLMSALSKLQS